MGWTFTKAEHSLNTIHMLARVSSFGKTKSWQSANGENTVLVESVTAVGNTVYGVLRITNNATGYSVRTAFVVLTERRNGDFGWKEMTEGDCPNKCAMPLRLLKRLSPPEEITDDESQIRFMQQWRESVRAYHQKRDVKAGDILEFDEPLSFGAKVVKRFEVLLWSRAKVFMALPEDNSPFRCAIDRSTLDEAEYAIHPAQAVA